MAVADKEELLKVLDEDGGFSGEYVGRKKAHDDLIFHNEISLWIINKKGEILLERRSANKRLKPNKLAPIAGHVVGDETIEEALEKEAFEEVGICVKNYDCQYLNKIKIVEDGNRCYMSNFYIVADIDISEFVIQEEELSEVLYMDYYTLVEKLKNGDDEFCMNYESEIKQVLDPLEIVINDLKK